jgi:hypothetical protein
MKNLIAAITLAVLFTFGTSLVNAGIIVQGVQDTTTKQDQCTETTEKTDWGIIVQGFTGIIVQGFTGIIVQGAAEQVDCGIIVQG